MLLAANGRPMRSASMPVHSRPQPQPDAEERVRAMLKSMDSLLDVRWFPNAYYNERHKEYEGRYALICQWPQVDTRWEMYHSGEIGEPFDFLGWFCTDIHDADSIPVGVDSMEAKVLELLGKCDNTRQDWKARMADAVEKNRKLRASRQAAIGDKAADIASTLWTASGRHSPEHMERILKEIAQGVE